MTRETFLMNHLLALRTFSFFKRSLLTIGIRFAMPFHMLVKTRPIEFLLAVRAHASKFQLRLWRPRATFVTAAWMVTLSTPKMVTWLSQ